MRQVMHLFAALFIILSMVGAAIDMNNLKNAVDNYNSNIEKAPATIKTLLEEEKVSIAIAPDDGSLLKWGFETKNAKIVSYAQGDLKNPTIEVYATEKSINDVLNAEDPVVSYLQAEKAGNIKIVGKTLGSSLRLMNATIGREEIKMFLDLISP